MKQPHKTRAIVLRRIDYGEADRIITLLTEDHGKIRVMAKGVRKSKSKMAGGIELFSISEVQFIQGRSDISTLMSTRMLKHFGSIVKDLQRTELAYGMLKKTDKTLEDDTGQEYFEILQDSLAALDSARIPPLLAEASFDMRLLQRLGHVPDFRTDHKGRSLDPDGIYDFDHEAVAFKPSDNGQFNKNHIKLLKLLAHNSPQKLAAVQAIGSYLEDLSPLIRLLSRQYIPN